MLEPKEKTKKKEKKGGGGAMAREPPVRRNDAALLSKIASQEKRRYIARPGGPLPPPLSFSLSVSLSRRSRESIRWLLESGWDFNVEISRKNIFIFKNKTLFQFISLFRFVKRWGVGGGVLKTVLI